jgi:hypothetical protein
MALFSTPPTLHHTQGVEGVEASMNHVIITTPQQLVVHN